MSKIPTDGGTTVDLEATDGSAPVAEDMRTVLDRVLAAKSEYENSLNPEDLWVELTVLADPDEEIPRRPTLLRADKVVCLTYLSPDHVEKIEEEIS